MNEKKNGKVGFCLLNGTVYFRNRKAKLGFDEVSLMIMPVISDELFLKSLY